MLDNRISYKVFLQIISDKIFRPNIFSKQWHDLHVMLPKCWILNTEIMNTKIAIKQLGLWTRCSFFKKVTASVLYQAIRQCIHAAVKNKRKKKEKKSFYSVNNSCWYYKKKHTRTLDQLGAIIFVWSGFSTLTLSDAYCILKRHSLNRFVQVIKNEKKKTTLLTNWSVLSCCNVLQVFAGKMKYKGNQ